MEELNLNPGAYYFGSGSVRLLTLLGSCVAVTLWHPRLRQGGICHYLLPGRPRRAGTSPDGRYAEEAFGVLLQGVANSGSRLTEYELAIFGGGNMFPDKGPVFGGRVGARNIEAAWQFARQHALRPTRHEVGGNGYRKILFELNSGRLDVKYVALPEPPRQCQHCCNARLCHRSSCRSGCSG